jgi:hypothetical protein
MMKNRPKKTRLIMRAGTRLAEFRMDKGYLRRAGEASKRQLADVFLNVAGSK